MSYHRELSIDWLIELGISCFNVRYYQMTSDQISSNEPLRWSADGLFYQLFIITNETFISTAGIWWIESTQLGLTVDRVVVASDPRNVVVVVIRNVPHPTLPDGPAGGGRQTEADHQGDGQELQQTHFYISTQGLPSLLFCLTTMKIFISRIFFKLIQSHEKIKYLYDLGLAYYHIRWHWHVFIVRSRFELV